MILSASIPRNRPALNVMLLCLSAIVAQAAGSYGRWTHGPSADPDFFPIAVWLQNPDNAERFKAAGINLYVGLWRGPTASQLETLRQAGMSVICHQNATGLAHTNHPTIVGWMHDDEPDNAQSLGEGRGYGPPIAPATIVADYHKLRAADPTRPILLNLGQGVAWDNWIGRGVRRNHPEDYPEYVRGADILSFDIYPAVHPHPEVAGKLEFVARGVERLRGWAGPDQLVWNCIECTRISNTEVKPTPDQVRTEVWMSLIHGSQGLIYFVHQFQPTFREAALLDDPEMLEAVTRINRQIQQLAPVLNSPSLTDAVTVNVVPAEVPVACMVKRQGEATWLFAVAMRPERAEVTFRLPGISGAAVAEVLDESRSIPVRNGQFSDVFEPYAVHLYRARGIR
ncbi:MAG: hypothetical protein KJ072_01450 [Verrucomicrobia bacterium]|nr:hypothetical protein [Verrucomicrobiota bacterium]